jgi:hypothetical protein
VLRTGGTRLSHLLEVAGALDPYVLARYATNRWRYRAVANPYLVVWVRPKDVVLKHRSGGQRKRRWTLGTIESGDWDFDVIAFSTSLKYQGVVEHFEHGIPWGETTVFRKRYGPAMAERGEVMGCTSIDSLIRRYELTIDPLFDSLRSRGLRPPSIREGVSPVHVMVGRSGDLIWGAGGNHRLAIAKLLDVEWIPARVLVRHVEWQAIRERVRNQGPESVAPRFESHPDLQDLLTRR